MNLSPYINTIESVDPLKLKGYYRSTHWMNYNFNNVIINRKVRYITKTYPNAISRRDIVTYLSKKNSSLLVGFIMTMIWGHGSTEKGRPDNRGPWKVAQMLEDLELAENIFESVSAKLKNGDIRGAHAAFKPMQRCRVNFFSKFLYFLGLSLKMTNYPLIFDARVTKTIAKLTSTNSRLFSTLSIQPNQDPDSYVTYVNEIHKISKVHKTQADKIEYFLFNGI